MTPLLKTITDDELAFIASLDYGQDAEKHLEALRSVIFQRDGQLVEGQYWYPYEVIELGSHHLQAGHEREFFFCTMLVLQAVQSGFDESVCATDKFDQHAHEYEQLPVELRDAILDASLRAGVSQRA